MDSNGKINILQLVNGLGIGGGELKLLELVQLLNKNRFNITVASLGQGGPLKEEFEKLGLPVFIFNKKHRFDTSLIFKIKNLLRDYNIHILQTTLFYADFIGACAAMNSIPAISWEVVTQPNNTIHKIGYAISKRYLDCIITVSDATRNKVISERNVKPEKVKTIHYGVDTKKYKQNDEIRNEFRAYLGIQENEIVLGTVARLTRQKGHTYLIDAAPAIVEKYPNVKFVFVGHGNLHKKLALQVDKLGLKPNFLFLGTRNDVPYLLNVFDIFVLPSLWEGLPNAILEAMSCSKPIVATEVDGTPELIEDGITGKLIPAQDSKKLADAIINILSEKTHMAKMGIAARKRIEQFFSVDQQIKSFENLYEDIYQKSIINNKMS